VLDDQDEPPSLFGSRRKMTSPPQDKNDEDGKGMKGNCIT